MHEQTETTRVWVVFDVTASYPEAEDIVEAELRARQETSPESALLDFKVESLADVFDGEDRYLRLSFTPGAIREHFDGDEGKIAEWVEAATDEQLREVGQNALQWDSIYSAFHRALRGEAATAAGVDPDGEGA